MFDVNNRTGKKRTKIAQFIFTIMVFLSYILNYDISNEIIKSRNFIYPVITQVLILVFEVPSLGQISCLTVQLDMVWVLVGSSTNKIYSNINNVHASIINEEYHRTVFCLFFFFATCFIQRINKQSIQLEQPPNRIRFLTPNHTYLEVHYQFFLTLLL